MEETINEAWNKIEVVGVSLLDFLLGTKKYAGKCIDNIKANGKSVASVIYLIISMF